MSGLGAVRLDDVGKRYTKYDDVPLLLSRAFRLRAAHKRADLWAVRHVNLDVEPGETVGVIGRNGSGKSTMLRMLAGVTAPTEGSVKVRGRVAPLISVGVGFHPELTGRENVYVNATVLGMRRQEIDRLFDSILAFAEIADFIDTPVKFYSSGMFVRLGFSVAVASRPDVLLIDEVLAVGDVAFQTKCFDRMEEIRNEGTSVLVVSHNLNAVRLLCRRTLVLHNGVVKFLGPTDEAISLYHELLDVHVDDTSEEGDAGAPVKILSFSLLGEDGRTTNHVRFGEETNFVLEAEFREDLDRPAFSFVLANDRGQIVYSDYAHQAEFQRSYAAGERARFEVKIRTALPTGSYKVRSAVRWMEGDTPDRIARYLTFFVSGRPLVKGLADLNASFAVSGGKASRAAASPLVPEDGSEEPQPPVSPERLGSDAM
jgi:ABC-type polysaccharide/polyol phosphate transport system ATPase subunit